MFFFSFNYLLFWNHNYIKTHFSSSIKQLPIASGIFRIEEKAISKHEFPRILAIFLRIITSFKQEYNHIYAQSYRVRGEPKI